MRQIIQDPPDQEIEQVTLKSIEGYCHNKIYAAFKDTPAGAQRIKVLQRSYAPGGFRFQALTMTSTRTPLSTISAAILYMLQTDHTVYEFDSPAEFHKWAATVSKEAKTCAR